MVTASLKEIRTISAVAEEERMFAPISACWEKENFYITVSEETLRKIISEQLGKILKERYLADEYRIISNPLAEKEISQFILDLKKQNISKVSILDVVLALKLPPEQVDEIMIKFEKEGRVSELNEASG